MRLPAPLQRLLLLSLAPKSGIAHQLALNAVSLVPPNDYYAQQHSCPNGYHWASYDPPRKRKNGSRHAITYRVDSGGKLEKNVNGTWLLERNDFNGVIYVGGAGYVALRGSGNNGPGPTSEVRPWRSPRPRGGVRNKSECSDTYTEYQGHKYCIHPSVAKFSKLTVASHTLWLNGDLTYEDRPCSSAPKRNADGSVTPATCNGASAQNVLGVYADRGDVTIGGSYNNLHIDGVLMSARGKVRYYRWNKHGKHGDFYLTGGIIQKFYGRLGRLDSDLNLRTGYGRKFTYDPRLRDSSIAPPFFPRFTGGMPWTGSAIFSGPTGGNGSGFWTPVKGD